MTDQPRPHFYRDVPKLGHVAVSRHAQAQMDSHGISPADFEKVLTTGQDIPDGQDILWRQSNGIRAVIILYPTPNRGARLVKTVYRIQAQAALRLSRQGYSR